MSALTRREFVGRAGAGVLTGAEAMNLRNSEAAPKRVAAIVTHYTHNSHADVIVSRLLQGYNLDFQSPRPNLQLVSLYTDQVPKADMSRKLSRDYGFPIVPSIAEALTSG